MVAPASPGAREFQKDGAGIGVGTKQQEIETRRSRLPVTGVPRRGDDDRLFAPRKWGATASLREMSPNNYWPVRQDNCTALVEESRSNNHPHCHRIAECCPKRQGCVCRLRQVVGPPRPFMIPLDRTTTLDIHRRPGAQTSHQWSNSQCHPSRPSWSHRASGVLVTDCCPTWCH